MHMSQIQIVLILILILKNPVSVGLLKKKLYYILYSGGK